MHHDYWWTVVRVITGLHQTASTSPNVGQATTIIPSSLKLSHNTAFMCAADGRSVIAYGGRRKQLRFRDLDIRERGIHRSVAQIGSLSPAAGATTVSLQWSEPELVLDGSRGSGCVERRSRVGVDCEFDGKLSVVEWKGRTLIYARANTAECGARHIQMSSSADGVRGWSQWAMVEFEGESLRVGSPSSNLYYFTVRPHAGSGRLLAFFPAVVQGGVEGGIYASTSDDGLRWRAPERVLRSDVLAEWRTADYPVDGTFGGLRLPRDPGIGAGAAAVHLLVEEGVVMEHGRALDGCARPPRLCMHSIALPKTLVSPHTGEATAAASLPLPPTHQATAECAEGAAAIVFVMRGEAFRWGCSEAAQQRQLHAVHTHLKVADRLEAHHARDGRDGCARFVVSLDNRGCDTAAEARLLRAFGPRLRASRNLQGPPKHQADASQAAMRLFAEHYPPLVDRPPARSFSATSSVPPHRRVDVLVFSRLDLVITTPERAPWACVPGTVCAASKCEEVAWKKYRCVNDVFFMASGVASVRALARSIGSSEGSASDNTDGQCGCFDEKGVCKHRLKTAAFRVGTGHDCLNVIEHVAGKGAVSFAWPQVAHLVGSPHADYALPQCGELDRDAPYYARACRRAMTILSKGGASQKHMLVAGNDKAARHNLKMTFLAERQKKLLVAPGGVGGSGGGNGHPVKPQGGAPSLSVKRRRQRMLSGHEPSTPKEAAERAPGPYGAPQSPRIAVCLTGQLRVMVRRRLHHALKAHLIDTLRADTFVHVDLSDTRQWGMTKGAPEADFEEVVRVLRPIDARVAAYTPPPPDVGTCSDGGRATAEQRTCLARDCGSFTCGCYVNGCTHCVATQYIPQHEHAHECLRMVASAESRLHGGRRYDAIIRIRPDLNVTRPIRLDAARRLLGAGAPPTFCALGMRSAAGEPSVPLAEQALTLDDKFAILPRHVADVYMNATSAFRRCTTRVANMALCGGGGIKMTKKGGTGDPAKTLKRGGARSLQMTSKYGVRSAHTRAGGTEPPYWATPQCILKRHLVEHIPRLHMTGCTWDGSGERGVPLRLIRPEMDPHGRMHHLGRSR